MADAAAGITKWLPLFGYEFPSVLPRRERELQDAERVPVADFAVWSGEAEQVVAASSGPSDDFPDSICGVGLAFGVLCRKALVGMFVSGKNQVGVGGVQVFPELLQLGMYRVPLENPAAEERMVAIGKNAIVGMLRKILFQPSVLR